MSSMLKRIANDIDEKKQKKRKRRRRKVQSNSPLQQQRIVNKKTFIQIVR